MRIGIFTDTYTPDINGVVTSIVTLQHALEQRGHEVFIITNHKSLMTMEREGNIIRMPGVELKWLYGYILSTPFHFKAKEAVKQMNLDVIHCHTEFGVGIFGRIVAKGLGIPIVTTYHTMYEDYTHYINFFDSKEVNKMTKRIASRFSRFSSDLAQGVICPSEKTKETLEKYGVESSLYVIPTGINLERFKEALAKRENALSLRESFGIAKDDFVVSYVGRIAQEKSIDQILIAFSKVANHLEKAKLLIVGGGPQLLELKELAKSLGISNQTVFTGKVENHKIAQYYQMANVFASASLTETQGMTYIEALASGLCVLAKIDPVVIDLISQGNNGYLFNTVEELGELIEKCYEMDTEEIENIRNNAQLSVTSYDVETFVSKVQEVYEHAIESYVGDFMIEKIVMMNDFVKITVFNESENEVRKLLISVDSYFEYHIRKGITVSSSVIEVLALDEIKILAKQKVLKKLKSKDLTRKEVYDLLNAEEGLGIKEINDLIEEFEAHKYINDESYVVLFIEKMNHRLKGKNEILKELVKKGIPYEDALHSYEHESKFDENEKARKLAVKYVKTMVGKSVTHARQSIVQKLKKEGFENSISEEIVNELDFTLMEENENSALIKLVEKAYIRYSKKYTGSKLKQKLITYAMSKGFTYDAVIATIREMELKFDEDQ